MDYFKYSVLMSVYYMEKPAYLRESIVSMLNQSVEPDEIVLVKDGALTDELEMVIDEFKDNEIFKVVSLDENVGLGKALDIGLRECRNELIARMDTDDISVETRCERQLRLFQEDLTLSVVGSTVSEFIDDPENIVAYKIAKAETWEIEKQIKYRNPMNHPSVMFKKAEVLKAGGYKHCPFNEDYYLWIRMVQQGFKLRNIRESLVKMRITDDTYLRRGGLSYFITQKKLQDYMLENNLINLLEYSYNNLVKFSVRVLMPNSIRKQVYMRMLRKKGVGEYD